MVRRCRTTFTTRPQPIEAHPTTKVNREFEAEHLNQLWVADITHVATRGGFAYVAFVADVFSLHIISWSVSSTLKTEMMPFHALNMAPWNISEDLLGLVDHSDQRLELSVFDLDGSNR
jgi:putative transposase